MIALPAQLQVCRRFAVEPTPPVPGATLGIDRSGSRGRLPLNALRHPPRGAGTGWFVWWGEDGIAQDRDDFFAVHHVEHVAEHAPALVPYLALPPGWRVLLAPDYEDVWYDGQLLDV
jgi:hypothetical protein